MSPVDEILEQATKLSAQDRVELVSSLMELDAEVHEVSDEEVHSRVRQLENGEVEDIGLPELRQALGK